MRKQDERSQLQNVKFLDLATEGILKNFPLYSGYFATGWVWFARNFNLYKPWTLEYKSLPCYSLEILVGQAKHSQNCPPANPRWLETGSPQHKPKHISQTFQLFFVREAWNYFFRTLNKTKLNLFWSFFLCLYGIFDHLKRENVNNKKTFQFDFRYKNPWGGWVSLSRVSCLGQSP